MTEKAQEVLKKKTGNSENDALVLLLQQDPEWQETIDDITQEFQNFYQVQVDKLAGPLAETWITNFKEIDIDLTTYKYDVVRDISYKNEVD